MSYRPPRTCYTCGQRTYLGGELGLEKSVVNQTGHQARDCQSAGTPLWLVTLNIAHVDQAIPIHFSYNCGESGHISRDCTGERKEKACYKCNEVGHISRDCPNATEGSGPECYKCGKPGHISRNCPEGYSSGGSRGGYAPSNNQPKTCYTCGGVGHMSRDCNQGSKCYNCGNTGHISRECPEERKEKACYKCNEVGHISRDCPQQA
ncbi:hypothetical protein BGX33_001655 [Mortierella sp. NVP41]|nr:hypothetical protein BGX33_001655 [Mortierella sp. NVP41]